MVEDNLENRVGKEVYKPKDIRLDLKEMIDIVAQGYRIETTPFYGNLDNETDLLGLHIDDGRNLEIIINAYQTKEEKNYTIIHECYHALFRKYNLDQNEDRVNDLAMETYYNLYGETEFIKRLSESRNSKYSKVESLLREILDSGEIDKEIFQELGKEFGYVSECKCKTKEKVGKNE